MPHKPRNPEVRDGYVPELSLISARIAVMERAEREAGHPFTGTSQARREIELYAMVDNTFALMATNPADKQVSYDGLIIIAAFVTRWAREERLT